MHEELLMVSVPGVIVLAEKCQLRESGQPILTLERRLHTK